MHERNTAAAVMDPNPTWVKPEDRVVTALNHIMKYRYRNLPVVDNKGRYVGIFGVNYVLRLVLPKAALIPDGLTAVPFINETLADLHQRLQEVENEPLSKWMSTEVTTVPPDKPLVETLLILYRTKTSIPVVEPKTGKLVGMISYWDVTESILSA